MDRNSEEENRWGAEPGAGEIHDLDFDFENYFKRNKAGELSAEEQREWQARVYGLYCSSYYKSGGDPSAIPSWVAGYVADRLFDALQGRPWADNMQLPWDEPEPWLNPKGERAMAIYCGVENGKRADAQANTTSLIAAQAEEHNVSYETARADYYAIKKGIDWKTGVPEKFLKDDHCF